MSVALCRIEDIDDPGAKGFSFVDCGDPREIFVVRVGDGVNAYVNSCPHIGTPLEFQPDRFLTQDGSEILCSTHGARFEIDTGRCVAGPCRGQSLRRVLVTAAEGWVRLNDPVL